jgi:hypothetical protein
MICCFCIKFVTQKARVEDGGFTDQNISPRSKHLMSILPRPKPFGKALKRMEDSQRRTAKNVENQDEVQALTGTFIRKTFESVDPEQVFKSSKAKF